jgi:tetratricopeptide (TPR) repeat protein
MPPIDQMLSAAQDLFRAGRVDEVITLLERAIAEHPASVTAIVNLAAAYLAKDRVPQALHTAQRGAQVAPDDPVALQVLGVALLRAGRAGEAQRVTAHLAALCPDDAMAHYQHGDAAACAGDWPTAFAALRRAVKLQPGNAGALGRFGNVLRAQDHLTEAADAFRRAAAIDPSPDILANWADALIADARPDEAIEPLVRALQADPSHFISRVNLGCARMRQSRVDDALAAFDAALRLRPDFAGLHFYRGVALLKRGNFEEGWRELEARFAMAPTSRVSRIHQTYPSWTGEPLSGRTILLYTEQGFGDAIQFARYIPLLASRGARKVIVACKPSMQRLLASLSGVSDIVDIAQPLPGAIDLQCAFMSLPLAFGTRPGTIPADVPYLAPPPPLASAWALKLADAPPGRKVGIAWAGSPTNTLDRYRSCRLDDLAPILDVPGVTFFSLQKGPGEEQLRAARFADRIVDHTRDLNDWAETAALVANLDLVISVDTGVIHLAGAMNKPVWTLLSTASEWRWMERRDDSPWYPSMRLFRQAQLGNWRELATRVAGALSQWAPG